MDAPSAARVKQWLRANRGDETQEDLAADITRVTGWRITRDRYSKYEGKLPIGRTVLAHFVDYWATRGRPGPFDAAPEPTTATETPDPTQALIAALTAQTEAITALVAELRLSRVAQVEATTVAFEALGALGVRQAPPGTQSDSVPERRAGTGR